MAEPKTLSPLLPTKVVHQFPLPTWIENLAIRSNGQILLTILTTPELYLVDPLSPDNAILIHKFPGVLNVTGITEVQDDIFYVAGGKYNVQTLTNEAGSSFVWKVDMASFEKDSKVIVTEVAHVKSASLLNGMELLSKEKGIILIADSEVGVVWQLDVNTGAYSIFIEVDEMKPALPPGLPMGINGLKLRDGFLYWTNTGEQLFCRVKLSEDLKVEGSVEVLAKEILGDDFVFDKKGNAWVTQHGLNTIGVVKEGGELVIAAGKLDEFTVAGGTACQFGRTGKDESILYVVTTGALSAPVKGSGVEGGKLVAVDTTGF